MPNELVPSVYKKLIADITSLYENARKSLVEAYWKIGQRIVEVEQKGNLKAAYGAGLLAKLSEDLTRQLGSGFSERSLERMRAFYLQHPKSSPATKLTWAHHIELLSIRDRKKRFELEKRVEQDELDRNSLRTLVRQETIRNEVARNLEASSEEQDSELPELLTPVRGTLYAYRIIQPKLIGAEGSELLIDLGFSSSKDLEDVTSRGLRPGDIVTSAKDPDGSYKLSAMSSKPESLFTYSAQVEKVVDGDTLRVVVDLGFGIKTRQYLRLRGLNCPEIDTPEGKKASDFVKARIRTADQIIMTSSRSDKYDRYLADIYFTNSRGQEAYLNNLLLREGLAVNMGE